MADYQVLARKYRPQLFRDVVGQEAIVTTLIHAIQQEKTAHAYLFCGSRGTGKTTLARLFAKALNCQNLSKECEPCNVCSSCKEIAGGHSLDVLEIDGASHRGIEDIRQIHETIGYAPTSGRYKIYLIDEVHMLTKEAFNALLKTLEEPPSKVKFFFATTEPHKIPATILSRCQRFNLKRISTDKIQEKLALIASDLSVSVHPDALHLIGRLSEGGLRDAESLFDQILAYQDQEITLETVSTALGILPKHLLFVLDEAGVKSDYSAAFKLAQEVFGNGMNVAYFLDGLLFHFRTLLLLKIGSPCEVSSEMLSLYQKSLSFYSEPQLLEILDLINTSQQELKFAPSERIAVEMLLLRILRTHRKISLDSLVTRLIDLEKKIALSTLLSSSSSITEDPTPRQEELPKKVALKSPAPVKVPVAEEKIEKKKIVEENKIDSKTQSHKEQSPSTQKSESSPQEAARHQSKFDTLMRFAAKELDGSLKKE